MSSLLMHSVMTPLQRPKPTQSSTDRVRTYKWLGLIAIFYVTFQLASDVTAGKITNVFGFPVSVTVLWFPITYIFADILTEVYGYARARSVVWNVFFSSVTAGII